MAASSPVERVRAVATTVAERSDLVLEDVTITPAGRRRVLRVIVDLPDDAVGGVGMDAVAVMAQQLSAALDADGAMGETPYVLEVSSPGIDRPLTARRHFARARGRRVRIALADGREVSGRLRDVDDAGLGLADGTRVGWEAVVRGRVEVEFSRSEGADAEVGDDGPGTDGIADPRTDEGADGEDDLGEHLDAGVEESDDRDGGSDDRREA
ncbi:MAG: ribosome maturation factor RimP [Actinomycetales bacterium]|nr:ribosome maturation factor RimP [Actinomycetales bacterium]